MSEIYAENVVQIARANPDWATVLVGDKVVLELLSQTRPIIAEVYQDIRIPACRSDIGRQLLLEVYGGWYLDVDIKCEGPLVNFSLDRPIAVFRDDRFQLAKQSRLTNSLLFIPKGHPLPSLILDKVEHHIANRKYLFDTLSFAGPKLLSSIALKQPEGSIDRLKATEWLNAEGTFFQELSSNTSFSWRIQQPFGILPVDEPNWSNFPKKLRWNHAHSLREYLVSHDLSHLVMKIAEARPDYMENRIFVKMMDEFRSTGKLGSGLFEVQSQ
ncbi:glycosyltransferase [Ruegeria sp. HKCCA5491]|uniref:glycosyltransferase n=1 Tax=Ruegeria sp. HKCCA5491 TaxID=2682986 RepID=UPI001489A708|nr:glycosyltransferase [Ruegeria sp. HKCCA5491]